MTRFIPHICRSGGQCRHICVLQNGRRKQEFGYSRTSSTLYGNRLLGGCLDSFPISLGFPFSMDFPFLPGWSFIPIQKSVKPWHDPSSTFCSPWRQFPGLVHTCWWEIQDIWVLCESLSPHDCCWAVAEGLWGRTKAGGHFPNEKWLWYAASFSLTLHYRALYFSFSEFLVEW